MEAQRCFALAVVSLIVQGCGATSDSERADSLGDHAVTITEVLRIGGLEGAEEYTFGRVTAVAPRPDDGVYVADGQVPIVRVYDSHGTHELDIGGRGEGPGEFASIDGMGVVEDQRVVVWDGQLRRLSVFNVNGDFIESISVPEGLGMWRGFQWSTDGDVFVRVAPPTGLEESSSGLKSDWAKVSRDGRIERLWSSPDEDRVGPNYVVAGRGGYYYPFVTATLSAVGADGSYYEVRNDQYRIRHMHLDGRETVIERSEPRIAVTSEELAEWEARSESFAQRIPEARDQFFPVPKEKPYIRELVTDPDGRLWVSRYTEPIFVEYTEAQRESRRSRNLPDFQWRDQLRWDVYGASDEHLGSVTLPPNTSLMVALGQNLWVVQSGELDEDYVVLYRATDLGR